MSRIHSRQNNGRFRRATMANTFGLQVEICPSCRGCNLYSISEAKPDTCCQCGQSLDIETAVQESSTPLTEAEVRDLDADRIDARYRESDYEGHGTADRRLYAGTQQRNANS